MTQCNISFQIKHGMPGSVKHHYKRQDLPHRQGVKLKRRRLVRKERNRKEKRKRSNKFDLLH